MGETLSKPIAPPISPVFGAFGRALERLNDTISRTMLEGWEINGQIYPAMYDEAPQIFTGLGRRDDQAINGTARTLTLFRESGYRPKVNDRVKGGGKQFLVKTYHFQDGLIVLQLE